MKNTPALVLALGGVLFLAGAVVLFLWMEGRSDRLLTIGLTLICVAVLSLAVGGRWIGRGKDPLEKRREQRLWRSGPLGRSWLGRRKKRP